MSAGKGDTPRPLAVDRARFEDNWQRIFGRMDATESAAFAQRTVCAGCGRPVPPIPPDSCAKRAYCARCYA